MSPKPKKSDDQKMPKEQKKLAKEIIKHSLYMKAKGLTPGHSGNVSARLPNDNEVETLSFLITPTGMPYEDLKPKDIVLVTHNETTGETSWDEKGLAPSSEWQFHLSAYQANSAVNALVHTHSNFATTIACANLEIPPFHYMVAAAGGKIIPLVPYAIFGSKKLSDGVAKAFKNYKACLMAHHGLLTGEKNLAKAMELTEIVEDLAKQFWALKQLGEPALLSDRQMNDVIKKFQTYGQQKGQENN